MARSSLRWMSMKSTAQCWTRWKMPSPARTPPSNRWKNTLPHPRSVRMLPLLRKAKLRHPRQRRRSQTLRRNWRLLPTHPVFRSVQTKTRLCPRVPLPLLTLAQTTRPTPCCCRMRRPLSLALPPVSWPRNTPMTCALTTKMAHGANGVQPSASAGIPVTAL